MLTRRRFLERGLAGGAGLLLARASTVSGRARAAPPAAPLARWVEPLPIPPVIDARGADRSFAVAARQSTTWRFHPDLPPTTTWGYWSDDRGAGLPYLGPTIQARCRTDDAGEPVTVAWRNELDAAFLPNDARLPGAVLPGDAARIVTHLHGGENLPQFDGTPLQWYTRTGETGPHFVASTFTYSNEHRSAMLWYHDHALGNTRTNVYAGLAGVYLLRDDLDTGDADNPLGLPAGPYEVPLVLQDKSFAADGRMLYPPRWEPEFFGDVAVVNGKAWPVLEVEPRRYRLRIVNGSQSRFWRLRFVADRGGRVLRFTQIGNDGGLLREPVELRVLLLAPGERADLVVDLTGVRRSGVTVVNDAPAPFPDGEEAELREVLRLRVDQPLRGKDRSRPAGDLRLPALPALPAPSLTRVQHLSETLDPVTETPLALNLEDRPYLDPQTLLPDVTTRPAADAVEDWLLVNTTADTHPIHVHLATFEVLDRTPFDVEAYDPQTQRITTTGPPVPRAPNENGQKDTVRANPGEVTRIRLQFELPDEGTIVLPPGVAHPQYVWHCHILEHEENDMMRAFEVVR